MGSVGRPTKRNTKTRAAILAALAAGLTYERAARAAGVSYDLLREWRRDDPSFASAVDLVNAKIELRLLEIIHAAAPSDWRASAWLLERRFPETWGRNRIEVTGKDGGPVAIAASIDAKLAQLSLGDLERLASMRIPDDELDV